MLPNHLSSANDVVILELLRSTHSNFITQITSSVFCGSTQRNQVPLIHIYSHSQTFSNSFSREGFFFAVVILQVTFMFLLISVHCNNWNSMLQTTSGCPATPCRALGFCCTVQKEVCVVLIAQRVRNTCQVCREISEFKTL